MSGSSPSSTGGARGRDAFGALAPLAGPPVVGSIGPREPDARHPLTTLATPILPPRGLHGDGDVWEELDRAAAWVCDHWSELSAVEGTSASADDVRQPLRVLCVAVRSTVQSGIPPERHDFPWNVPVSPLLRAIRRRLLEQTVGALDGLAVDLVRVLAVIEQIEGVVRHDVAHTFVDQLTGTNALDLLVEVAHDMRSPLGSILFLVERLRTGQSGGVTAVQERQLGLIYGAAFGLSSVVGDVMELARGGDRLAGGEPGPLSIAEILNGVRDIVQPIAEEKRLTLNVRGPTPDVRLGHSAALHRVLLNLVTNALKFTPEGTVELLAEQRSRTRFAFVIQDTGRGIPPAVLSHLFQTFRRRAEARDYAFSSAGLGLAICQKLIAAMGGELHVDSELGRGTRFQFDLELPLAPRV